MNVYPADKIYEEMAFIAYYLHWSRKDILEMSHRERIRWCREVSLINQKIKNDMEA